MRSLLAAGVLALGLLQAAPGLAQDAPEPKVNQLIVFGNDPCPPSEDGLITVCARKAESERYRIPENLRQSVSPQNEAWNNKVLAYERVMRTGTMSCSAVGAGGWTGCSGQLIDQAYAEKKSDPNIRFSELIAAEREKRLAELDAEANETQTEVEKREKEYFERQKQLKEMQEAAERGETPPPPPE